MSKPLVSRHIWLAKQLLQFACLACAGHGGLTESGIVAESERAFKLSRPFFLYDSSRAVRVTGSLNALHQFATLLMIFQPDSGFSASCQKACYLGGSSNGAETLALPTKRWQYFVRCVPTTKRSDLQLCETGWSDGSPFKEAAVSEELLLTRRALLSATVVAAAVPSASVAKKRLAKESPGEPQLTPDTLCASVAVHSTPKFETWINAVYLQQPVPEAMSRCVRCLVCKCVDSESALVLSFFPAEALRAVQSFYRDAATGAEHVHFVVPSIYRTPELTPAGGTPRFVAKEPSPDVLAVRRGEGIMFGAHGIGNLINMLDWTKRFTGGSIEEELLNMGVKATVAGELLSGSTDARLPGPGRFHATASASEATALAEHFKADPRVKQLLEFGVFVAPLYAVAATVVRDDTAYGGQRTSAAV